MQIKHKPANTFDGSALAVGIVTARFNQEITKGLLQSAMEMLQKFRVKEKNIKAVSVAGSMEIPYALQKLAKTKKYDCLVALGCIIRGETPHFDYVCKTAQEGVLRVSLDCGIPVGFGVITANNLRQARARRHLGGEAAVAALELTELHC